MTHFTPWTALAGGILIGLAAVLLLWLNGRVAGVSGIAAGLWWGEGGDRTWRILFLLGLIVGSGVWVALGGAAPLGRIGFPVPVMVIGGLLVGYGTALSGGCTSGHGVCGLARLSPRSIAATAVFLVVAIITTAVARHVLHIA
jgi:uncharacterized membrane protein YedE/YeeE